MVGRVRLARQRRKLLREAGPCLRQKYTILRAVKDTKLSGRELLGKPSLDTEDLILTYVTRILSEKGGNPYTKRDADRQFLHRVPIERIFR